MRVKNCSSLGLNRLRSLDKFYRLILKYHKLGTARINDEVEHRPSQDYTRFTV
ncbi:hypothetical protein ACL6C3_19510 [Capilliphycus salinus ALCB114379]|uniref:hypothetical protein n=1 Tax=Capilliphycus salinus TaxID=2768948 RepID=UPI0039A4FA46